MKIIRLLRLLFDAGPNEFLLAILTDMYHNRFHIRQDTQMPASVSGVSITGTSSMGSMRPEVAMLM
jgi:hypothetical protein